MARSTFKLEFKTENAAFEDDLAEDEICKVLCDVIDRIGHPASIGPNAEAITGVCRDSNGNKIGQWSWQ
jgi:hypothetical protein